MDINEIQAILIEVAEKLETLNNDATFREIQDSENFNTPNDLVLVDALQAIYEIEGAIAKD